MRARFWVIFLAVGFFVLLALSYLYVVSPDKGSPKESFFVKIVDTLSDNFNPFRNSEPENDFVSEYDFFLSGSDLNFFWVVSRMSVEAGYKTDYASDYKNVDLDYNGVRYRVKMALFGDGVWHYRNQKKSFKVKSYYSETFNGMKQMNFILPAERTFIGPIYTKFVAERVGLPVPSYEVALVRFNGVSQGLYIVEEAWGPSFLERVGLPGTLVVQRSENWMKDHTGYGSRNNFESGVTYDLTHVTPFDLEISNVREIDSELNRQVLYRVREMFKVVEENDQSRIGEFFDLNRMARVLAWSAVLERSHDFCGDNLRMFYDTTTGKFWFVPRSEGGVELLPTDLNVVEDYLVSCANVKEPILRYVSENEALICERNRIILGLLEDKEALVDYHLEVEDRYKRVFMSDATNEMRSSKVKYYIERSRENLLSNLDVLERLLVVEG